VNILATPATPDADRWDCEDSVDYAETVRLVNMLVDTDVDALMTNGTFGEGATLTEPEWRRFNQTVVEAVDGRVPVFGGATTLNTRDTIRRAREMMAMGFTGLFLGRPMWQQMDDDAIVGYYSDVAEALPDAPVILYDNPEAFKGKLSPLVYSKLAKIPNIVGAKYLAIGPQYMADLAAVGDNIALMPLDSDWYFADRWAPGKARATWTGSGNCGMAPLATLRDAMDAGDSETARRITLELRSAYATLFPRGDFHEFSLYNIQLEKARFNAAQLINAGPCRPPYQFLRPDYAQGAQLVGEAYAALQKKYAPDER
jgi:4-(2-carboxyphenyl)-2-oxobut-3-enoate aldolase